MEVDLFSREVGSQCECQLAAGHDIDVKVLLFDDLQDCGVRHRFSRVLDVSFGVVTPEIADEFSTHFADSGLVEDVDRAAELFDNLANVHAVDREAASFVDRCRDGQDFSERELGHSGDIRIGIVSVMVVLPQF